MDLARLRTLGTRELAGFATFLPALFLPDMYTRDVPGIPFLLMARAAAGLGLGGLVSDHVLGKG